MTQAPDEIPEAEEIVFDDVAADELASEDSATRTAPNDVLREQLDGLIDTLAKRDTAGSTYIFLFNTGHYATLVGQGGRDINIGVAQGKPGISEAQTGQSIAEWYAACAHGNNERDGCLVAAIAFLVNGSQRRIFEAASALHESLELKGGSLANTIDGSLERVGAARIPTPALRRNQEVEALALDPPERNVEIRQYLWTQVVDAERVYARWLVGLGGSADIEVSGRVGLGVGALSLDLARAADSSRLEAIYTRVIEAWALEGKHARNALGQALCTLALHDQGARMIRRRLGRWTAVNSTKDDVIRTLNTCRSSWAALDTEGALDAMRVVEGRVQQPNFFKLSQNVFTDLWVGASMLRDERRGTAQTIVEQLVLWSSDRPDSVFFRTPQLRLAHAIERELEETDAMPLILESAVGDAAIAHGAARLFVTGLMRARSAGPVRGALVKLEAHARVHGHEEAFVAFQRLMEVARPQLQAVQSSAARADGGQEDPPLQAVDNRGLSHSSGASPRFTVLGGALVTLVVIAALVASVWGFGQRGGLQPPPAEASAAADAAWAQINATPRLQLIRGFIREFPDDQRADDALALARERMRSLNVAVRSREVLVDSSTALRELPTLDLARTNFLERPRALRIVEAIESEGGVWLAVEVSDPTWPYRFVYAGPIE